ncbi:hypothetical protein C8R45DRAFT_992193 [Mycena sanguinolenta]|nr:hypothetical protein C8R45DRAFT_992193 [Mycena sanguinolenta]
MTSQGTWNSPIYISDDEDEQDVAGQLVHPESDSTSTATSMPHTQNQPSTFSHPVYPPNNTGQSVLKKRKRDDTRKGENSGQNASASNAETKKARKRRRRMERQEAMAQSRAQSMLPPFSVLPFLPPLNPWGPPPGFNPYSLGIPPHPFPPNNMPYNEHGVFNAGPSYPPQSTPYTSHQQYNGGPSHDHRQGNEQSTWVSSMAASSNAPNLDFWDQFPPAVTTPPPPPAPPPPMPAPRLPPPAPPPVTPAPPPPKPAPRPVTPAPPPPPPVTAKAAAPKKPISLIIGMNPDQDKHSKHGTFNHSPQTIVSPPNTSGAPYIPNPARTIVMEQLPKTHRTRDFIKSWCKGACGAQPVYFAVDPSSAKALIEFPTAELARKAWGSPKLGAGTAGPPVKGKPRADLIRVWWYRVDGVGAGAGVGEIEEGEIVDDPTEREASVPSEPAPVKKETKRERRARHAKEREEAKMLKSAATSDTPASAPIVVGDEIPAPLPYTNLPPPGPPPPTFPSLVYHHPPSVENSSWNGGGGALLPPPLPFMPPPQSRPPLPPQAALENQWQARYPFSYSAPPSATILPGVSPVPPPMLPVSFGPGPADGDVDMELETPATPTFPYPFPSRPVHEMAGEISGGAPVSVLLSSHSSRSHSQSSAPPTPSLTPPPVPPPLAASAHASSVRYLPAPTAARPAALPTSSAHTALQPPPLEPRAMKNAPKGPSFAKRSLVARHKDLEERIARGRAELGLAVSAPAETPTIAMEDVEEGEEQEEEKKASAASMEDNLRRLVLKSQKRKNIAKGAAAPLSAPADLSATTQDSLMTEPLVSEPLVEASPPVEQTVSVSSAQGAFSLDDLAVSFITETIQTLTGAPPPHAAPPPMPAPTPSSKASTPATNTGTSTAASLSNGPSSSTSANAKQAALAAKQRELEQQIAESKTLMAQLANARSKQEKDRILAVMREQSRYVISFIFVYSRWRRRLWCDFDSLLRSSSFFPL